MAAKIGLHVVVTVLSAWVAAMLAIAYLKAPVWVAAIVFITTLALGFVDFMHSRHSWWEEDTSG